ncbi:MAG TPA: folate hydrolase, partial [Rhodanobacter sp.]|nr:folate hydrolase [Rhodanobacter sp.]
MIHRKTQLMLAMALATFGNSATASSQDEAMLGFSRDGATAQHNLEQRFDAQLDPADQRNWLKQMSSEPNQVGSPHDKANAEFMLAKFREWGWDAHIETFSVLYPTPKKVALELLGPHPYTAVLK